MTFELEMMMFDIGEAVAHDALARLNRAMPELCPGAFDCDLVLTQMRVDPTTQQPARCQIRIEDESPVD